MHSLLSCLLEALNGLIVQKEERRHSAGRRRMAEPVNVSFSTYKKGDVLRECRTLLCVLWEGKGAVVGRSEKLEMRLLGEDAE